MVREEREKCHSEITKRYWKNKKAKAVSNQLTSFNALFQLANEKRTRIKIEKC